MNSFQLDTLTLKICDGPSDSFRPLASLEEYLKERVSLPGGLQSAKPSFLIRVDLGAQSVPTNLIGVTTIWQFVKVPSLDALAQVYECVNDSCSGVLTDATKKGPVWFCPVCHVAWSQSQIGSGIRLFGGHPDHWGDVVARYFDRLGGKCDILLMRRRVSVKEAVGRIMRGEKDADIAFAKTHGGRHPTSPDACYFTLSAIIKDTSAGSTLARRIAAFLRGG